VPNVGDGRARRLDIHETDPRVTSFLPEPAGPRG
jgi:hypothetical protein